MPTLTVELKDRSYPIEIKRGLISEAGFRLKELGFSGKCAVVTNPLVYGLYGDVLLKGLLRANAGCFEPVVITVPDGEEYKTLAEAEKIYDALVANCFERGSPIIALGGGVIGDIAGFVAATYLRGVPYIQVPTTLLAEVDSSVGGKTAVNHSHGKNLIGSFYQPQAVLIDPDTLSTLEERDVQTGLAEVVKYGVILERDFFDFLEKNASGLRALESDIIIEAISRSCAIKARVVAADEFETSGQRAVLNLGHTFGHAIEALSGYGQYRHGEAVAMGMVLAARFSVSLGLFAAGEAARLEALILALGLPVEAPKIKPEDFIEAMRHDKKVTGGRMRFILIREIGSVEMRDVTARELEDFLS
ncbi:MAG: 3-dehydroquinate synthase [Thermodesulfobacteriota bacterium]